MHGSFDRSGESNNRISRSWSIGFFVLPALLVITVVGLAITHPVVSIWISEAVQAEFVDTYLAPDAAPTRLAQPGSVIRTVKAY